MSRPKSSVGDELALIRLLGVCSQDLDTPQLDAGEM